MSEQLKLWFFRDLTDEQRLKLFGLFGLPVDEIGNVHGLQTIALRHIVQKLIKMVGDEAQPAPADKMAATEDQREAWMDGDTTGAYVGTEGSKRLPLKAAPAEQLAALMESGKAFANQVRAVTYMLNGQAYSSTVSALNQFDADLRRIRTALATATEGSTDG